MNRIVVTKGNAIVRQVPLLEPLDQEVIIGRGAGSVVQLESTNLSRRHARVFRQGMSYFICDLGSTNGTVLDGRRIEPNVPFPLGPGSHVQIGDFDIRFQIDEGEATMCETPKMMQTPPLMSPPLPRSSPLLAHLIESRETVKVWDSGEISLVCRDIIDEAPDVKTFRLAGTNPILFSFQPGQFVTLHLVIAGKEVRRSYSISSSPSRPYMLDITVKRVPAPVPGVPPGLVSNFLHDHLKLGDTLRLRGPSGKFSCFAYPSSKLLLVGAGSGITPMMSMARWIVDTAAEVDVKMLYCVRSPSDLIFRKELENMSAQHRGVQVLFTVSSGGRTEGWTGLIGRVQRQIFELLAGKDINAYHVFLCGPPPFMQSVKEILKEMQFPLSQLHSESFGTGRVAAGTETPPQDVAKKPSPPRITAEGVLAPVREDVKPQATMYEVTFSKSGKRVQTDGTHTLLELAEVNGIEIDNACRSGSCLTCKIHCAAGTVTMEENGLSEEEQKQGYILTCVGRPKSASVVLDV